MYLKLFTCNIFSFAPLLMLLNYFNTHELFNIQTSS